MVLICCFCCVGGVVRVLLWSCCQNVVVVVLFFFVIFVLLCMWLDGLFLGITTKITTIFLAQPPQATSKIIIMTKP